MPVTTVEFTNLRIYFGRDQYGEGVGSGDNMHERNRTWREAECEAQFEGVQEDHTCRGKVRVQIGSPGRYATERGDVLHRLETVGISLEPRPGCRHCDRLCEISRLPEPKGERGAKFSQLHGGRGARRHGWYFITR